MKKSGQVIFVAGLVLFVFMLASLVMMSEALQNSERFDRLYSGLLLFISIGLVTLTILIGLNLRRLIRQLRKRIPGSRMTVRMVVMLSALSVTPVLIVYYFSLDFLHRGIDNWFDLEFEQALDDSLELSRLALDLRMKEILKQSEQIAGEFTEINNAAVPFEIDEYRVRSGAEEFTLLTRQGSIIASSTSDTLSFVPTQPNEAILFQVQQGSSYIGLDTIRDSGLSIRVAVNVPALDIANGDRIILALFPVTPRINDLAKNVESSYIKYKELSYLREQLKVSFILILTLVLLFSIFSAVWAAFYSARRLAAPIRDLAEGTRAVAEGDYNMQLPVTSRDELGFLVASFNQMTRKIGRARDEVSRSQQEAEAQHAYIEAVLGRLSSGVMVLDSDKTLRTANISSGTILAADITALIGLPLHEIASRYQYLEEFIADISADLDKRGDWAEQMTVFGTSGRQILMCRGTSLSLGGVVQDKVYVIVFDDITALIQGQRDAAWSEMARRLAHEIKNPLTPIKLAAERLRHKYLTTMEQEYADTLDRLTTTIIQQVETMRDMVNDFSDYARAPVTSPELIDINELLQEVVDLYSTMDAKIEIEMQLGTDVPKIMADPSRLRQVFNNLLNNAIDAIADQQNMRLTIGSKLTTVTGADFIEIRLTDAGPGIEEDIIGNLFEPYVTTKQKGTGLGLAIVKKIIEEHGGIVWLENNDNGEGACAVIRLPMATAELAANMKAESDSGSS
ncbi:MAG: HAMP domain-containing protein [Gammaproteobacteria bacterium]|nr:HAMP domain-containing protein [Gammaproteobacteria bacterium]